MPVFLTPAHALFLERSRTRPAVPGKMGCVLPAIIDAVDEKRYEKEGIATPLLKLKKADLSMIVMPTGAGAMRDVMMTCEGR